LGARVPDLFYAPTATLSLRETVSLQNDANGNMDCIFTPNVRCPVVSFRGSIQNGTTLTTPDGTTYAKGCILNNMGALSGKIVNYRIVSWGLRIRNTSSMTNASGVLSVALVPPHQRMRTPNNDTIGGQGAGGPGAAGMNAYYWLQSLGAPIEGSGTTARVDIASLVDLPYHARYQGAQLAEQTFEVHPKLTSPQGLEFRYSNDSYWGTDMQATTSAVYVNPGDASYLFMDGWTSVILGFSGGGGTSGTQTFDVEVVYHLEGSPQVQSGTIFISDSPVSHHDPVGAMLAQAALNAAPAFTKVSSAAMAALRSFAGAK